MLAAGLAIAACSEAKVLRAPVVQDLPTKWSKADAEFGARIRRGHPPGSSAAALEEALTRQGFRPAKPWVEGQRHLALELRGLVCNRAARVLWTSDAQDRIETLRTRYGEEGCL